MQYLTKINFNKACFRKQGELWNKLLESNFIFYFVLENYLILSVCTMFKLSDLLGNGTVRFKWAQFSF